MNQWMSEQTIFTYGLIKIDLYLAYKYYKTENDVDVLNGGLFTERFV